MKYYHRRKKEKPLIPLEPITPPSLKPVEHEVPLTYIDPAPYEKVEPEEGLSFYETQKLRAYVLEIARRQCESLKLYHPLTGRQTQFHESESQERIVIGSNQSGKTTAATIEVARAVTHTDPHGKYPAKGHAIAVGKDGRHISRVMWKKLAKAGAIRMIRDEFTGLWRDYRPWTVLDSLRYGDSKPAPPILAPRFIEKISWENKAEGIPSLVTLRSGWTIEFKSGEGKPPQGHAADLVWFDEEIPDADWYTETAARLIQTGGKFIWSATPQVGSEHLYNLHCRAEDREPGVQEFFLSLMDNPFITEQAKEDFISKLTEEEKRVRVGGEFRTAGWKVYPEFTHSLHVVEHFHLPENWMRFAAIDPGRQICAVLFGAVPPDNKRLCLYDELYIRNCNAEIFGQAMQEKCRSDPFRVFLIDGRAARITEMGSGRTVEQQYAEALDKYNISSELTGSGFIHGNDDVSSGILSVRSLLHVRTDGTPRLMVRENSLANFEHEMERYHYKRIKGLVTDQVEKKHDHLMDCLRYIASYDPTYYTPAPRKRKLSGALAALKEKLERKRAKGNMGAKHVRLGPGKERW